MRETRMAGLHGTRLTRHVFTRILPAMSLKDIDIESALRRLADRRIEEAMREGKFTNPAQFCRVCGRKLVR